MHVHARLRHSKHLERVMDYELYDINCAEVCAILNKQNPVTRVKEYILRKLESKMPTSLYNFDIEDWWFV